MADQDKAMDPAVADQASAHSLERSPSEIEAIAIANKPPGWKYKQISIAGHKSTWYASPTAQLLMVSFVCFMCPGMFNALTGLGGGGKADPDTANKMNIALYACFAVFGFFGGSFVNRLGVRPCLSFGGIGYTIYAISLLVSVHKPVPGFNIFAGVLLGVCAGLLWTAQGTIMLSYPAEASKGRHFAWFWAIFNMGGVIGALIPLGQNINITANVTVTDGTYIGFIILMFVGAVLALLLCSAKSVYRPDGTHVILMKNPSWKTEFIGLYQTVRDDPYVILLFPMFFVSNWFYTYHFNDINGAYFNTRTKSLNNVLYWAAQIIGAGIFGYSMDYSGVRRTIRARICLVVILALTFGIWGGGYAFAKGYTRWDMNREENPNAMPPMDWLDGDYLGPMFLYLFYGVYDAAFQAVAYWCMGALSNSGRKSANLVGFYKGIQSAGNVGAWAADLEKVPYNAMFGSSWGLVAGSLAIAAPLILFRIKDSVDIEEDLKFSDETRADVSVKDPPEEKNQSV